MHADSQKTSNLTSIVISLLTRHNYYSYEENTNLIITNKFPEKKYTPKNFLIDFLVTVITLLIITSLIAVTQSYTWLLGIIFILVYKLFNTNDRVVPYVRMLNNNIIITNNYIEILNPKNQVLTIKRTDLNEIIFSIDRKDGLAIGSIFLSADGKEEVPFISLFGESRNQISDDLDILIKYIYEKLNIEELK